jgi:crooked neck
VAKVQGMMPVRGKKRHVDPETGQMVEGSFCSFMSLHFNTFIYLLLLDVEWVFADDERESNPTTFKFMAMAHAWKMSQAKNNDGGSGGGGGTANLLSGFTAAKVSVEKDVDVNSDVASSHGDQSD